MIGGCVPVKIAIAKSFTFLLVIKDVPDFNFACRFDMIVQPCCHFFVIAEAFLRVAMMAMARGRALAGVDNVGNFGLDISIRPVQKRRTFRALHPLKFSSHVGIYDIRPCISFVHYFIR